MISKKYIFCLLAAAICSSAFINLHAAYSAAAEWSTYVGGAYANDAVKAMTLESSGRLYFGGYLGNGELLNDDGVEPTTVYGGELESFVGQVAADGTLQWYALMGGELNDETRSIAEYNQSVYAGVVQERGYMGISDGTDALLYALSKSDGSLSWSAPVMITGIHTTNGFNAVTVDDSGNIYAVGYTDVAQLEGVENTPVYQVDNRVYGQTPQGDLDACVMKVSPTGEVLWSRYIGGARRDVALSCAFSTNGFLYVGGETYSTGWVSNVQSELPTAVQKAGFLVKLNTDGEHIWSTYLSGSNNDAVSALAYDPLSDTLFAAGTTYSADFMNQHNRYNTPAGGGDAFVCSVNNAGAVPLINWIRFYGSTGFENLASIKVLDDSELVIAGTTLNGGWLPDADASYSGSGDGYMIVIQTTDGSEFWSTYTGGVEADGTMALAARNGIFYSGGITRSEGWVSGGFNSVWNKDNIFGGAEEFGFLTKYQSSGYAPDPPLITAQPQAVTVEEQQNAYFSISVDGTEPFYYQWRVNDAPVSGANNAQFTLTQVQLEQSGDLISCLVSNAAGTALSVNALLTVTAIPNGFIQITLAPPEAVTAGARWSIDAGATWRASGESVNVITGVYTIVYKDGLFGWAVPTTPTATTVFNGVTNSLNAQYTQVFYTNYRQISGTNVVIHIDPPVGSSFYFVTETLPVGITPAAFAPMTWNETQRQLTHTVFPAAPVQLSYVVTGEDGTYQVAGNVNFGSGNVTTVGDDLIVIGATQPEPPPPDIVGFAPHSSIQGSFLLTFISVADQQYLIETNASPAINGWGVQQQINGAAEQSGVVVPATESTLFYRVRAE